MGVSIFNTGYDLQDQIDAAESAIAIVSIGDTHVAITSGQYVYVREHGTLAEGLYRATANIAANGTLSGSNVTAVSGGGLNALNSNLANKSDYIEIDATSYGRFDKSGWDYVYSQLPTPYKGMAHLMFSSHYRIVCLVQKYSATYGSIIGVSNDNENPFYYGVQNGHTSLDNLAFNSKLVKTNTKTETTDTTGRIFLDHPIEKVLSVGVENANYWCYTRFVSGNASTAVYIRNVDTMNGVASTSVTVRYSYID